MAKLSPEINKTLSSIKQTLLDIMDEATAVEFILFEKRGETNETISFLDEMKNVSIQAEDRYFQLSKLEVSIAQAQPTASNAMIDLLTRAIEQNQLRIRCLATQYSRSKIRVAIMINNLPPIPNQETRNRLLNNLRRTNLELEEFGLELDKIMMILEQEKQQNKLNRVKQKLNLLSE